MATTASLNQSALPWDQELEYIRASERDAPPGIVPAYTVARWQNPVDPADTTSYVHGQRDWSLQNLPPILDVLDPSESWLRVNTRHEKAEEKLDAARNYVLGWNGEKLRDFAVLPNRIGTLEHPPIIEAWRRLDPCITWKDIDMRMHNLDKTGHNTMNNQLTDLRERANMVSWHMAMPIQTQAKRTILINEMIKQFGAATNSTARLAKRSLAIDRHGKEARFIKRHEEQTGLASNVGLGTHSITTDRPLGPGREGSELKVEASNSRPSRENVFAESHRSRSPTPGPNRAPRASYQGNSELQNLPHDNRTVSQRASSPARAEASARQHKKLSQQGRALERPTASDPNQQGGLPPQTPSPTRTPAINSGPALMTPRTFNRLVDHGPSPIPGADFSGTDMAPYPNVSHEFSLRAQDELDEQEFLQAVIGQRSQRH